MKYKKIIITGGTGFIGQAMARYFGKENQVILLSRQKLNGVNNNHHNKLLSAADGYNITYWRWDGQHIEHHWAQDLEAADIVINLAGKSVNCRYTEKNKAEIINSRIDATRLIGEAIQKTIVPPKLWINAASATIYRNTDTAMQDEFTGESSEWKNDNMPFSLLDRLRSFYRKTITRCRFGKQAEQYQSLDKDFSVKVCRMWEQEFFGQRTPFTRKIAIRTAVTLGDGGVMIPYYNLLKFGLGGRQGNGRQWYSWVHIEDLCRAVEWFYDHPETEGVYNIAAPNPVRNEQFMSTLRKMTGHVVGLPAFNWMLELGAALIGTETELILKSRRVIPARLLKEGFQFKYEHIDNAFRQIVEATPRKMYHLF